MRVFDRVDQLLREGRVLYEVTRHEPVFTSEQAAAVRGTELSSGAKALVVKVDGEFQLFVLPADRKLASKKVRAAGVRRMRFASKDEVLTITGLEPGAIPPFGSVFGLATICDLRMEQAGSINFNAGAHDISISMSYNDFLQIERPRLEDIAD